MAIDKDSFLKNFIRKARLLSRSLDLICNISIVVTVTIMLAIYNLNKDVTYTFRDSNGVVRTQDLFPKQVNLTASYILLGFACFSLLFSIGVMLSYLRSHKLAGKVSTSSLVVEILGTIVLSIGFLYGASLFQIPKVKNLARDDLWAASCLPIRKPAAGPNSIPENVFNILFPICSAGDWSVVCSYISGALQALMFLIVASTLLRVYFRYKTNKMDEAEDEGLNI